ncbi:hypothetical protein MMC13_001987 [Lambiella insularis]|nr:hypothetical protein [Lambiella insularis]
MQEHIRRAHPEHYISKLPATEESFQLMINTPPSARPPQPPPQPPGNNARSLGSIQQNRRLNDTAYGHDRNARQLEYSSPAPPRNLEDAYPAAATAAVALAQLHNTRPDSDWESENEIVMEAEPTRHGMNPSIELPPLQNHFRQDRVPPFHSPRPRELLPSMMAQSPPARSTTLPPIHRSRPRKSSLTKPSLAQSARKPKHERTKSKDQTRRLSIEGRKAFSAEPPNAFSSSGSRWEDLIEAATSANEADSDRDLTPIPQSPASIKRSSLPPFPSTINHFDAYKASPLQNALTPPPPDEVTEPFPSVESSIDSTQSGINFHMPASGLSNSESSPTFSKPVEIYCANCARPSILKDCYACTECIRGFCSACVYVLNSENHRGSPCPRCRVPGPTYKPFQLDLR